MADKELRPVLLQNDGKKHAPIIIVPGLAVFLAGENWKRILQKNGHTARVANLYSIMATAPIDEQARRLFREIEEILARLEAEKCHLFAFSMGGITALHFLKKYNLRNRVLKCICVAAPFHGIRNYLKIFRPSKFLVRGLPEIMRGSQLLADITAGETAPLAEIYTVRGNADFLCANDSCYLSFANNLPPTNGGHLSICCGLDKQAVGQVLSILAG